jgi:hypothetical protein
MAINKATSGYIYWHATSTTMTTEAMTSSAGNVYQVSDTDKQIIDPAVAITVAHSAGVSIDTTWKDNGFDYYTGKVKLTGEDTPTLTGAYYVMTTLASVVSWSLPMGKNAAETTALGDTWKKFTPIETGATLTINRFYADTEFWSHINSGNEVLVQIWEDDTEGFWCKGYVTSFGPSMAVGQVDNEAITLQLSGTVARF